MSLEIPEALFQQMNVSVPRYTSYPTAPEWICLNSSDYQEQLSNIQEPLSLYVHIPFCHSMCLFCGCSVILNRKEEKEKEYIHFLKKEIDLLTGLIGKDKKVYQLHFGGGTPTKLSEELLYELFYDLKSHFSLDLSKEIAIEVDPRTVVADKGKKLALLKNLGFNRVSFGVQDLDPKVQDAVRRRQTEAMTIETYLLAKELGYQAINIDLIYGLPFQTQETFCQTIFKILSLKPDRIALFSYAKIPWLKAHQKAIDEAHLPSTQEKFRIYSMARKCLVENGYIAIGMDHFALKEDELAQAYFNKTLQRNFQGYSLKLAQDHLPLGVSSIGFVGEGYFQNHKELKDYYQSLKNNEFPIHRGKILNPDDKLRKWVIHTLMCNFELNKAEFSYLFSKDFDSYFKDVDFSQLSSFGLIRNDASLFKVLPLGELFIRNIASYFDAYFQNNSKQRQFSKAI